jgi:hypothetical protein
MTLLVLWVPLVIIRAYRPSGRERTAIWFLVGVGCFTIGVGIARAIVTYDDLSEIQHITKYRSWVGELVGKAEIVSAITAVSLPAFRRFLFSQNSKPKANAGGLHTIGSPENRKHNAMMNGDLSEEQHDLVFLQPGMDESSTQESGRT